MDQLRNDSQRKAESTSAHRVALGQQQELEPESLEQQLKGARFSNRPGALSDPDCAFVTHDLE